MKFRLLFLLFLVSYALHSNAKHLEFMGIPIAGTINSFQTKLLSKGCTLASNNKELPSGVRGFQGVFAGKDCEIIVWYNHRTKEVYKVRAVTNCGSSLDNTHNIFFYFKNLLIQKYQKVSLNSDMLKDSPKEEYKFEMAVMQPPIEVGAEVIGFIDIFIIDYDTFPTSYGVSVTYEDSENSEKNKKDTLNDL